MKRLTFAIVMVALSVGLALGQLKKGETYMAETVDLTDGNICGSGNKYVRTDTLTGTVMRREFADDQLNLNGIVLRDRKDLRHFINIDAEYLSDQTAGLGENLSDLLTVGSYVRVKADVCGRIYVMRRMKRLRM